METNVMSVQDIMDIVKRRKWSLILPALLIFLIAASVSFVLPPIYKSISTILIEDQEIPSDLVTSTITSYAEQRLQTINQTIMSTTRLLDIINEHKLYEDRKGKWTIEEIVDKMREDISLEPISTEIIDRRTGRPTSATIAFTLSFEGKNDPEMVQKVANVLASLFLEENLKVRERQAQETSKFFKDEMERVKADLDRLEKTIADFKEKNVEVLPEVLQVNMQNLHNTEITIERINEQLRTLKEREGYLQSQLSSISPELEEIVTDKKRLNELTTELRHLQASYSDQYPDVILLKEEISKLEEKIEGSAASTKSPTAIPDNPAYINLSAQLAGARVEIQSKERQITELLKTRELYSKRIAATPSVEGKYNAIVIERDRTQKKYDDLMKKYMEATVAQGLEREQKGERFTLIDPANLPEKPYKPNRLAIMLIGLVFGIGAGIGFLSLREYSDHSVRSANALAMATSFPVLASIPEIYSDKDLARRRTTLLSQILLVFLVIGIGLASFHYLVMDFDEFWAKLMRKFTL